MATEYVATVAYAMQHLLPAVPMDTELPRYEWRYMPRPDWIEGPEAQPTHVSHTLGLMLITDWEEHLVATLPNPQPGTTPEAQAALATGGLNNALRAALPQDDGVFKALAVQTLFLQQCRQATAVRQTVLLDIAMPRNVDPVVRGLLAPSMGWMLWTWQLETLLRTARCTTPLSQELMRCWRGNWPRTPRLLEAMNLGGQSLREVVESTTHPGAGLEYMTITPGLLDCFQRHGPRLCGEQGERT